MKEVLSQKNVKYLYVDICESVGSLRTFLKVRDTSDAHAVAREKHSAGVPSIQIDDDVYIVSGVEHINELIEKYELENSAE